MELSKGWRGAVVFEKESIVRFFRFFESDIALIPQSNELFFSEPVLLNPMEMNSNSSTPLISNQWC